MALCCSPFFLVRLSSQSDDVLGGLPVGIALLRCLRFRSCANPPDASGVPMFVFFRSMVVYGFRIAAPAEHRIASSKVTGLKYSWISDDHVTDENIYLGCCGALVRRCDLVPLVGLEPTIFGLKVRCLDRLATRAHEYRMTTAGLPSAFDPRGGAGAGGSRERRRRWDTV